MNLTKTYAKGVCGILVAGMAILTSCGGDQFKVKGDIYGADKTAVVLEKSDFQGFWVAIDSTRTNSKGSFSIKRPAPAAPEIFRLEVDGKYIYFPVDSTETVTVKTSLDKFGREYSLTGSAKAELMEAFDEEVMSLPAGITPDSLASFKRRVFTKYMHGGQGSVVSYYILTKTVGGKPLFSPKTDFRYFAAVANGFKEARPDDPRAALLEKTALEAMRENNSRSGRVLEIEADELKIIDIALPDVKGNVRKLSDVVGNGKQVAVCFTLLTHPDAPALNAELSKIHNSGVDFYMVSLDPDQYAWRDAAANLPWVNVYDADGEYSKYARQYNVSNMPVFFIYGADGALKARANDVRELRKEL